MEENRYIHETHMINNFITQIFFGMKTAIWMILHFLFDTFFQILSTPVIIVWNYWGDKFMACCIVPFTMKFTRLIIIPIVDSLYPIFNIEKKFDQIIKSPSIEGQTIKFADPDDEIELTQDKWNSYIMFLNKSSTSSYDMFDILISQINFDMTVTINRTHTSPKHITYAIFYSKLKNVLGDAVDIQYRFTTNCLFVGIFRDQGPYRRFKYYDVI